MILRKFQNNGNFTLYYILTMVMKNDSVLLRKTVMTIVEQLVFFILGHCYIIQLWSQKGCECLKNV